MREKDIIIFIFLPLFHKVYFRRLPVCVFTSEGYQFVTSEGKEWMYLLQKVAQVEESSVVLRVNIQRSPVINFKPPLSGESGCPDYSEHWHVEGTVYTKTQRQFTDLHNQMKALILNQSMKETGVLRCILQLEMLPSADKTTECQIVLMPTYTHTYLRAVL